MSAMLLLVVGNALGIVVSLCVMGVWCLIQSPPQMSAEHTLPAVLCEHK